MDWKPGSIGVPTFHCLHCMKRWLKLGQIPESCSEPDDLTEGPAMCITDQSNDNQCGSPTMIVGGALGSDGKPVRIKVELPVNLQKMLKKERKKKRKRSLRKGDMKGRMGSHDKAGKSNDRLSIRGGRDEHAIVYSEEEDEDFLDGNSSDEDEDLLDLPDSLRKYILKKAARQMTPSTSLKQLKSIANSERQESTNFSDGWSMSDFTTSSLSSLASKVDSEEFLKYLESGDSGDVFLSDYDYSSNSQINMIVGENVSKPVKRKLSKGAVENGHFSPSDSAEMLYSSDNGTHLASTKSQSKVRNGKKIDKRRSRSFPESKGLESSSTHLPPIHGARSSQNISRYSTRKHQQKPRYAHNMAKGSDESLDFNMEGHSFHGLSSQNSNSFVHEDVDSSRLEAEGLISKDKNSRMNSHQYNTRSAMRSKSRKRNQRDGGNKSENELRLPNIFDGSKSPTNPSSTSNAKDSKFGADDGRNIEKPLSRNSQLVHHPQLNKDRGVIAQQAAEGRNSNDGEVMLSNNADSTADWRTNHGSHQDGLQSNSAALESEHREDFKSQSHAQFMVKDVSQSVLSARSSNVALGSRRGSVKTPLIPIENNQKRRPSRVSQATVQQDVEITVGRSNKSRLRPPPRQRRAKQSEEMPSLHRLSENNLNKTLSSHLPEKPGSARHPRMEMSSFHTEDNIPRRIGHKLVKKKKGDEHHDSVMHNSKDIGNIVEGTETANAGSVGAEQSTTSKRPSLISGLVEEFNSIAQSPLANSLKANQDVTNFGYNNNSAVSNAPGVTGAPHSAKPRPISGGGMDSRQSTNYTPASTSLQENNGTTSMLPPVRLKPLDPTQIVNLDTTSAAADIIQPLQVVGGQVQEETTENGLVDSSKKSAVEGAKERAVEEGLEAIVEESEPSESDDDDEYFDIRPIPELKPVSTLSFSSNNFSYYPMGRAHKKAYETVRQKAVGPAPPAKWGRSHRTPAKIAKRRKR